jgi:holo-[acyl-carrier-protein] synthase
MIGIDIVDIGRISRIYRKHGFLFLEKVLDNQEIGDLAMKKSQDFCKKLACYIASKEAIFKACSQYQLDWQDISIRNISQDPLISIRRPDFKKEIKLTFAITRDIVLSYALIA